jgi:hypothetical protein
MKIPGFTAESSLRPSSRSYRARGNTLAEARAVSPQQFCFDYCDVAGCLVCCCSESGTNCECTGVV